MWETLYEYCKRTGTEYLLQQWDQVRNAPLMPEQIRYGSKKKVWWRCNKGHVWQTAVTTRTSGNTDCPYCAGIRPIPGQTDLASCYPKLAAQWHPTKNTPLTPEDVLPGSHRKVWWICGRGHEWQAQIKSRVNGCGCPVCAGRRIQPDGNDLATRFPNLAAQWHPTLNGDLRPDQVTPGTRRKVWWICQNGHEWQAAVASRTSGGTGCPVCSGRKVLPGENDLAELFPGIAVQWDSAQNGGLTPRQVSPYSNRRVWWVCEKGHSYRAAVVARTMHGVGCPYCAGKKVLPGFNDLATRDPEVAAQWHPTLNGGLTPEMVTVGSHRKVWWECSLGHVWKAVIYSRTGSKRCGCPVCARLPGRQRRHSVIPEEKALGRAER